MARDIVWIELRQACKRNTALRRLPQSSNHLSSLGTLRLDEFPVAISWQSSRSAALAAHSRGTSATQPRLFLFGCKRTNEGYDSIHLHVVLAAPSFGNELDR